MLLPMNYDNYVFDLYGTLIDACTDEQKPVLWDKLARFYGFYNAIYKPEELKEAYFEQVKIREQKLKEKLEENIEYTGEAHPEIEIIEVFRELFRQKGVEADDALSIHAGQFLRILSTEKVQMYPGTEQMLKELKAAGKKVYLLSNAQRIFTVNEMQPIGILKYFDDVFISSDCGTRKPDKRFFDMLLEKHPLDPKRTIYVGNDSVNDVLGPKQVGFSTFYVNSNISPENDVCDRGDYNIVDFTGWDMKL